MKQLFKLPLWVLAGVAAGLSWNAAAQTSPSACEQAWANYNEFKTRNVMEESQYPLTVQGAAVRSACGQDALPAPPGSDTPLMPIIRDHVNRPGQPVQPKPPIRPMPMPN